MKKVLVLPFLNISSGHHQAADAVIAAMKGTDDSIECEKIDILSYAFGKTEVLVSQVYLNWIRWFPQTYSWVYRKVAYSNEQKRYRLYEILFTRFINELVDKKNPDLLICTHALPSYLLCQLKAHKKITAPVVNVYTDYFINRLWGIKGVEYHLVADQDIKEAVLKRGGSEKQVFMTGIPIHPTFKENNHRPKKEKGSFTVLITGGSLGVGKVQTLIKTMRPSGAIRYKILCGKNEKLFYMIQQLNNEYVTPLSYIECRKEMNDLYEDVDAVLTKPGGVTVSESLFKQLPIFIYDALPGQEELNLQHLKKSRLVHHLDGSLNWKQLEEKILAIFRSNERMKIHQNQLFQYHQHLCDLTSAVSEILYSQDEDKKNL